MKLLRCLALQAAACLIGLACAHAAGTVTVALTGDIMMGTTYPATRLPQQDGRLLFSDVKALLQKADIAAGNLEGTLCDSGTCVKKVSETNYAFCTPVSYAPLLAHAGYYFLSLANNHTNDFGWEGIVSTADALRDAGIRFAGIRKRYETALIEKDGIAYGFCAFGHSGYTCQHRDLKAVRRIITDLCNRADIVIVSFHGGAEGCAYDRLPYGKEMFLGEDRGSLREFARFCVDAGADIVFGHGPHVCRAIELYKNHLIAYSLGNFCTPFGISVEGKSGYAPLLEVRTLRDGRFVSGRIHSFIQQYGMGPRFDPDGNAAREIRRLTSLDMPGTPLIISGDGTISRKHGHTFRH